jgi:hypothetical protein
MASLTLPWWSSVAVAMRPLPPFPPPPPPAPAAGLAPSVAPPAAGPVAAGGARAGLGAGGGVNIPRDVPSPGDGGGEAGIELSGEAEAWVVRAVVWDVTDRVWCVDGPAAEDDEDFVDAGASSGT